MLLTLLYLLPIAAGQPIIPGSIRAGPTLPIPPSSTLSRITCLFTPPFSTHWHVVSDPHTCLSTCGATAITDVSALLRPRRALSARGTPHHGTGDHDDPHDASLHVHNEAEFDCICAPTVEVLPVELGITECDPNAWVVYTPLRSFEGLDEEMSLGLNGLVVQGQ